MENLRKVYIVAASGTKSEAISYLQERLMSLGVPAVLVDFETRRHCYFKGAHRIFEPHELSFKSRAQALASAGQRVHEYLASQQDISAVVAIGGTSAQSVAMYAFRALGRLIPKYLLTTMIMPNAAIEMNEMCVNAFISAADVVGRNFLLDGQIRSLSAAIAQSTKNFDKDPAAPVAAMTCLGAISDLNDGVLKWASGRMEMISLHSVGSGWQTIKELSDVRPIRCVFDLSQCELINEIHYGRRQRAQELRSCVAEKKIPIVMATGGLFSIICNDEGKKKKMERDGRRGEAINQQLSVFMSNWKELMKVGDIIASILASGPSFLVITKQGVGFDREGTEPMANPELLRQFSSYMTDHPFLAGATDKVIVLENHINDGETIKLIADLAEAALFET